MEKEIPDGRVRGDFGMAVRLNDKETTRTQQDVFGVENQTALKNTTVRGKRGGGSIMLKGCFSLI